MCLSVKSPRTEQARVSGSAATSDQAALVTRPWVQERRVFLVSWRGQVIKPACLHVHYEQPSSKALLPKECSGVLGNELVLTPHVAGTHCELGGHRARKAALRLPGGVQMFLLREAGSL